MKSNFLILLVEDNEMDIVLTKEAFRERNPDIKLHVVKSGEEALDYLYGRPPYEDRNRYPLPDLMLLDLKLPGIGGLEVLQKVKQTPILKRIPAIILTSSKDEEDRRWGYDYGCNSYLAKPVSFEKFKDIVKTVERYWYSLNVPPPLEEQANG